MGERERETTNIRTVIYFMSIKVARFADHLLRASATCNFFSADFTVVTTHSCELRLTFFEISFILCTINYF